MGMFVILSRFSSQAFREPDEINQLAATVKAVREGWPGRRLVLAFQPHRYSRTQDAFDDFVGVLSQVDVLVVAEVYPAGEAPIVGADGRALTRAIRARGQVDPVFIERIDELPAVLAGIVADDDVVVTMGAGDVGRVAAGRAERSGAPGRGHARFRPGHTVGRPDRPNRGRADSGHHRR